MTQSKSDIIGIRHMLDACFKANKFIKGKTRLDLNSDEQLSLALVRLIEILGEAASKITSETKDAFPNVMWKEIMGTRNRLIHGYDDVNLDIVWQIVSEDLKELQLLLERILETLINGSQQKLF